MKNEANMAELTLDLIRAALEGVYDPEFGVSIVDLGLIYDLELRGAGAVVVTLTLTTPHCPAGDVILDGARAAVAALPGVREVDVQLVWEPRWTPDRLTARAREQLGWATEG